MATSEADLKDQLGALDWGTMAQAAPDAVAPATAATDVSTPAPGDSSGLDSLDVGVAGVKPPKQPKSRRGGRAVRVVRQPVAQSLLDATVAGQTVAANAPAADRTVLSRRGRNTQPDVLTSAGESPAVIALFDAMWRDVGSKLARGIGRPKASRQDAAIGWYAMLLAMRERDAAK